MYDARIGRFLSIDPLAVKYPFYSPYAFSGNRVIDMVELEGLEPAKKGSYEGEYQVAIGQNWDSYYGYTWENGAWAQGELLEYSIGSRYNDHPIGGIDKLHYDGVVPTASYLWGIYKREDTGNYKSNLESFKNGLRIAIASQPMEIENEGNLILHKFVNGDPSVTDLSYQQKDLGFDHNSGFASLISGDEVFVNMASTLEIEMINYYKELNTLEGFGENGFNQSNFGRPVFKFQEGGTLFVHGLMGGTKEVQVQIRQISSGELTVRYRIWDHFGADTKDAYSNIPMVRSMYWLQHESYNHYPYPSRTEFMPFMWYVDIIRTHKF